MSELKVDKLWHEGPEFLRSAPENWPEFVSKVMVSPDEEVLCEIKGYKTAVKTSAVMQVNVQNLDVHLKAIIDANKYGDLGKLLQVTSYCLRFLHNLKCKHHKNELLTGLIMSQEISEAECLWLQEMQTNVLKEKGDKYLKQISKELGLFYDKR